MPQDLSGVQGIDCGTLVEQGEELRVWQVAVSGRTGGRSVSSRPAATLRRWRSNHPKSRPTWWAETLCSRLTQTAQAPATQRGAEGETDNEEETIIV